MDLGGLSDYNLFPRTYVEYQPSYDKYASDEDSSDDEDKPGIIQSIFGYWGFGRPGIY